MKSILLHIIFIILCGSALSQNLQSQINTLRAQIEVLQDQVDGLQSMSVANTYKAILKQYGSGLLEVTVLQNTLGGEVIWHEQNDGLYYGTLEGAFTGGIALPYGNDGFTFSQHGGDAFPNSQDSQRFYNVQVVGSDQIQVVVMKGDGTPEDLSVRNFTILVDILVP